MFQVKDWNVTYVTNKKEMTKNVWRLSKFVNMVMTCALQISVGEVSIYSHIWQCKAEINVNCLFIVFSFFLKAHHIGSLELQSSIMYQKDVPLNKNVIESIETECHIVLMCGILIGSAQNAALEIAATIMS